MIFATRSSNFRRYFSLDSDALSPEARNALAEAGSRIQRAEGVELYVEGHTDKRGTGEYNLALGERRGQAVTSYLVSLGVPDARLHVVSRGAEEPLAEGTSQADYAQNRRVEFRLMRGNVRIVLGDGTPVDDKGQPIAAPTK
ncbi:MAG: OmpA family protein [Polyangiales bacterium]